MPRDGSGNYTLPYPAVVDGTTIESAVHNGTMSDIALQLNGPVPIIAGGTGANNAHDAMIALSGEIAKQVVTNYDSHPFVPGSFYSAAGATGAPTGSAFVGIAYSRPDDVVTVLEAREILDDQPRRVWARQKFGAWGTWVEQTSSVADLDARYVNLTGDTMTGDLTISQPGGVSALQINSPLPSGSSVVVGKKNGLQRWVMYLGDSTAEGGGNSGSHFALNRINDAGTTVLGTALTINRSNGDVGIASTVSVGGAVIASGNVSAGNLVTSGYVQSGNAVANSGVYHFGNTGVKYLAYDGTTFSFIGAPLNVPATTVSTNYTNGALTIGGGAGFTGRVHARDGFAAGPAANGAMLPGDISVSRVGAAPASGALFFGTSTAYLFYTGTSYDLVGGALQTAGLGVSGAINITAPATSTPNIIRVGALIDPAAGRGYSLGVASTTDPGIGFTDIGFSVSYSSSVAHCPVAGIFGAHTGQAVTSNLPGASSLRIACVRTNTTALEDPQYYCFHSTGS